MHIYRILSILYVFYYIITHLNNYNNNDGYFLILFKFILFLHFGWVLLTKRFVKNFKDAEKYCNNSVFPNDQLTLPIRFLSMLGDFLHDLSFGRFELFHFNKNKIIKQMWQNEETRKKYYKLLEIERKEDDTLLQFLELFAKELYKPPLKPNQYVVFKTAHGRLLTQFFFKTIITNRNQILDYFLREGTEAGDNKVFDNMFIVLGAWRTGTTLLQNLLSLDPENRAMRNWEMTMPPDVEIQEPPPSPPEFFYDERIEKSRKSLEGLKFVYPNFFKNINKYHKYDASEVEEELLLLTMQGLPHLYGSVFGEESELSQWFLTSKNKRSAYVFLKLALKFLTKNYKPEKNLVLKTPLHGMYMDLLMEQFPKAKIIVCHRNPYISIASYTKLGSASSAMYADRDRGGYDKGYPHPNLIGTGIMSHVAGIINNVEEYRRNHGEEIEKQIFDSHFSDLMKDPIKQVENIYQRFGLTVSAEYRKILQDYLKQQKESRSKKEKVSYDIKETGLTMDQVNSRFPQYLKKYPQYK